MKKYTLILLALIVAIGSSCTRIDAGHAGIKVKMYGSEKGVQDVTAVTGRVWYNPLTVEVFEFPTFVQTKKYPLSVTDADGMSVSFNTVLNYRAPAGAVPEIFSKYRKTLPELEDGILGTIVDKAVSTTASKYTATQMYENREQFQKDIAKSVRDRFVSEGFEVDEFALAGEMTLPPNVKKSIEMKVEATQSALRKQQELAQIEADAAKRVAEAKGTAESQIALAEGRARAAELDAKANRVIANSITSNLLKLREIELRKQKWDGKYPTTLVGSEGTNLLISTGGSK